MKKSCKSLNQENHDADNLLGEMHINAMLTILLIVFLEFYCRINNLE